MILKLMPFAPAEKRSLTMLVIMIVRQRGLVCRHGECHGSNVKQASVIEKRWRGSGMFRLFARGHLLDEVDDAAAKLGIRNTRKCAGQRQPFRRREEV